MVSGLNPFFLQGAIAQRLKEAIISAGWMFRALVSTKRTIVVGRSTVCDDIASRLLFNSPVTPT